MLPTMPRSRALSMKSSATRSFSKRAIRVSEVLVLTMSCLSSIKWRVPIFDDAVGSPAEAMHGLEHRLFVGAGAPGVRRPPKGEVVRRRGHLGQALFGQQHGFPAVFIKW